MSCSFIIKNIFKKRGKIPFPLKLIRGIINGPEVQIHQGILIGSERKNYKGGTYYSFKGIPYAKNPVGKLRFRAPQPPEPWKGIRDCTKHGNKCTQAELFLEPTGNLFGEENCLFLNVYTPLNPKTISSNFKAVMVWIHGGSYVIGSGNEEDCSPDYLITEDIVLVTINYRLGAFGFLRVNDLKVGIPGNSGMKDVVMALKWINENIKEFGGNPQNVTICGGSAGAAITHMLTLSPLSKGLFQKAVVQSGSALAPWALIPENIEPLIELANALGIQESTESKIVERLEELNHQEIILAQSKMRVILGTPLIFTTTIEKPSNEPAFLLEDPLSIIKSGRAHRVKIIFGFTSNEGILFLPGFKEIFKSFEDLVPFNFNVKKGSEKSIEIARKIQKFYFGNKHPTDEDLDVICNVLSDIFFEYGIFRAIKELIKVNKENIYFYIFSFDGKVNYVKTFLNINIPGVCHGDEMPYLFKLERLPMKIIPNSFEDLTIQRLIRFWGNFVKTGDPNDKKTSDLIPIKWNPVGNNKIHYLDIGENLTVGVNPDWKRFQFWDEIYQSLN